MLGARERVLERYFMSEHTEKNGLQSADNGFKNTVQIYSFNDFMADNTEKIEMPAGGYVVIRCADRAIVARFDDFPVCDRALMYRKGDLVSFMPLQADEVIGTTKLLTQLLQRAGYTVSSSDIIKSSA
ncbi:hypothetical protein [Dickeya solani]|uniref:Uncharacterized protein n=1 Tax=Dickeya solani TaxID=1089444 RepID=A0ABU4EKP0_9GAMM|nr:hypothetical protein [Dickeya solani]MCZ0823873.1 hypothetical protein [Dickeya solani]MDV6997229.1 hypothetical protein [Dickeya solani]MDV7006501.1 hypothetical protein [Dickeya solani]MDV7040458.1 hypothetical protein [Dickeya solani]MDV7044641.1 hypothetical protein [Dickeya solani]